MSKLERRAASSVGALSGLLLPVLIGCTGAAAEGAPAGAGGSAVGPGGSAGIGAGGGGATGGVAPASGKPEVGVVTLRRLNRTQYNNTLRSLTGTTQDWASKFPPDNLSFGFDNIGEALTVQPLHIELFEQTAESVVQELLALPATDPRRTQVLSCDANTAGHACVATTVTAFAERAFRRPVLEAEVKPFIDIADKFAMTGGTVSAGMALALQAVLLSPHFLFRVELDPSPTSTEVHRLSAHELATRLSYYLWSDMPDAALLASAKSGNLATDGGLLAEVTRMLADPKSQALVSDFAGQWLNVRRVSSVTPDAATYPSYSVALGEAMQTETSLLFGELLAQGRPITELITASFTFVNAPLATFYGIPAPAGEGFSKVQLAGSHRSGFLMQGSFLTLTSNPTRTSPVKRGKWVLEQLLCSPPPPPPPGVNISGVEGGGQSVRAKLEAHRAKEPCRSCHAVMDPIGLSFENFDGVGQYRTADQYGPIDSTGTLPTANGPVQFTGADQLVPLVAGDARLAPCAAEKVLTYAVGRGFSAEDQAAIENALAAMDASGQGLRGLVGSVALSESFKSRRAAGE